MNRAALLLALFIFFLPIGTSKSAVSGNVICIDAGHGGSDPGAEGVCGILEKDVNLDVALTLRSYLEDRGAEVVMTRDGDYYVSLDERCTIANNAGADIFVSIHCNSYSSSTANGIETYWYTYGSSNSERLATEIQQSMVQTFGLRDRGVKQADYYVLKNTAMPAALSELMFISNPQECSMLSDAGVRDDCASSICSAIEYYFG
jgi:N-acetylmuramoyl-L-alanine amidase